MLVPKTYEILSECILTGTEAGINEANRHSKKPSKSKLIQSIYDSIMINIRDKFEFQVSQPNVQDFQNRITEIGFKQNGKDIQG